MSFLNPQIPTIGEVVDDTSPELGGGLDVNGYGISGATGSGAGAGGNMLIYGGQGGPTGNGGYIFLTAGGGGSSGNGIGGTCYVYGGTGRGTGAGGQMLIKSGTNVNTGVGGTIDILGGDGGGGGGPVNITGGAVTTTQEPYAGAGGDITITGGVSSGNHAGGDITLTPGAAGPDKAGVQVVDVGNSRTGASPTGLANDATVYTAAIVVDGGGSQPIAITGSAAQTYAALVSELDADTTGATWGVIFFDLQATSDTTGASSSIAITDTDLFSSLSDFVAIDAAIPGTVAGSPGATVITQTTAPTVTTNKLYNVAGALTWNAIDLTAGGGISNIVEDTSPQLGGELDTNDFDISNYGLVGITIKTLDNSGNFTNRLSGNINILGGDGTNDAAYGSEINIVAGGQDYDTYGGSHVNITGGAQAGEANYAGQVNIVGGANTYGASSDSSNSGGHVNITGGANSGGYYTGGVYIEGGTGGGASGYGGYAELRGGEGDASNPPGSVIVRGGFTGNGGNYAAGYATIGGGFGRDEHDGGVVTVIGGGGQSFSGGTGSGGQVNVTGGVGGVAGGAAGDVVITGGGSNFVAGNIAGGDIVLTPGAERGSGSPGAIVITATSAPTVTTNKLYNVSGALTWNGTDLTAGGGISKFSQDNTTTVAAEVFNHALGTTDVIVQVFDLTVTPKELMIPSTVAITDANNVTVTLAIAPSSSGDYRVVITG